ncbi:hypothetical protein EHS25_005065 [Saitozyma podzolica]|uniref:Uncharacterized protein n=1 Tax=Saitozyma podzolica TaxID=1890683 RepID=A0A427Y2A7_9TREE|nr:hypothetical protein EHS25_005065 [Saitozyma podzolica]
MDPSEGGSLLRFDDGQFFSSLQDDYCLPRLDLQHEAFKYTTGNLPGTSGSSLHRSNVQQGNVC